MHSEVRLGDVSVDVVRKQIKNLHLSVHPPTGKVRISAPAHMSLDTIRVFAVSKINWIRQQQHKLQEQERETPREYLERESHFVWGHRCLLSIVECDHPPSVEASHSRIVLRVRPDTDQARRHEIMEDWYRELVRQAVPPLLAKWERLMSVRVERILVRRMKTKWGSCSPKAQTIRLNTDLAKKPRECLEYVLVHEMIHLLEPTHNARFIALLETLMPKWQQFRDKLNELPVRHESWTY